MAALMDLLEDPDFRGLQFRWETSPKLAWQNPEVSLRPPLSSSGEGPPPGSPPPGPPLWGSRMSRPAAGQTHLCHMLAGPGSGLGEAQRRPLVLPSPSRGLDGGGGTCSRSVDTISKQVLSYSFLIDFLLVF